MTTSVQDMLGTLRVQLNDGTDAVWTVEEKTTAIREALKGLYPNWWQSRTGSAVAVAGTEQTLPSGALHLYAVYSQPATSVRARPLRNWQEDHSAGTVFVPQSNLVGATLTFCWTTGFEAPALDTDPVDGLTAEAEHAALILAQIDLIERVLIEKVRQPKYFAIQVRDGVTEQDIGVTLDTLEAKFDRLLKAAQPLPLRRG